MAVYLGSNRVDSSGQKSVPTFKIIANQSVANTEANQWFYTTISFTVPAGHYYLTYVNVGYNAGKPIGIGIHNSSTIESVLGAPIFCHENSYVGGSPAWLLSPGTYYLFCKRAGSSGSYKNNYVISALDFDLN